MRLPGREPTEERLQSRKATRKEHEMKTACTAPGWHKSFSLRFAMDLALLILILISIGGADGQSLVSGHKLSEDDVLLLLMGSAPPETKARLIRVYGIDSDWGDDFQERVSALCLEEDVRASLEQESRRSRMGGQSTLGSAQGLEPDSTLTPHHGTPSLQATAFEPAVAGIKVEVCGYKHLPAPDERVLRRIVERLTDSDARLENLLKNYTFHSSILARKMDGGGRILGSFYGEWDVMFTDRGKRTSQEVANSSDTTGQGVHLLRGSKMEPGQALVFLPEDRQEYTFRYIDHVTLDEISAYKLSVEPKRVEKGKVYFKGVLWVEDRSIQIVKAEGDRVPSFEQGAFGWRFYPHYVTFRSQSDGRFWLPTLTVSDGMAEGIRLNSVTRYFNYKRFGSQTVLRPLLSDKDLDQLIEPSSPPQ